MCMKNRTAATVQEDELFISFLSEEPGCTSKDWAQHPRRGPQRSLQQDQTLIRDEAI